MATLDDARREPGRSRAYGRSLAGIAGQASSFFGIHASNEGRTIMFASGIPLKREGKVVCATGVSGGSGEQDHAGVEAGAAAF